VGQIPEATAITAFAESKYSDEGKGPYPDASYYPMAIRVAFLLENRPENGHFLRPATESARFPTHMKAGSASFFVNSTAAIS